MVQGQAKGVCVTLEHELQREIQAALSKEGCRAFRTNAGDAWTGEWQTMGQQAILIKHARRFIGLPKGFPDLLVVCPGGKVVFMEIKTQTGRVSPEQQKMHQFLRRMGQRVTVARSVSDAIKAVREDEREDEFFV